MSERPCHILGGRGRFFRVREFRLTLALRDRIRTVFGSVTGFPLLVGVIGPAVSLVPPLCGLVHGLAGPSVYTMGRLAPVP